MKNDYKIIDMDTHVQPPLEVLKSTWTRVSGRVCRSWSRIGAGSSGGWGHAQSLERRGHPL